MTIFYGNPVAPEKLREEVARVFARYLANDFYQATGHLSDDEFLAAYHAEVEWDVRDDNDRYYP